MDYHLVCVHPFGKYQKGQVVTDPDEVAELLDDREHHFVRIAAPAPAPVPPAATASKARE
jgi:hypothetical protein